LIKTNPPGSEEIEFGKEELGVDDSGKGKQISRLKAMNFAELSGREEMMENCLRTGQNMYLLHRSYMEDPNCEFCWGGSSS
jgi:hypothetical protein